MSIKVEIIVAVLAIAIPTVCSIIAAAWMIAQGLGSLGQRVRAIEEICRDGFRLADERTDAAREQCEQKIVAAHGRMNGIEAASNSLAARLGHLEGEHGIMMMECHRHIGKAES